MPEQLNIDGQETAKEVVQTPEVQTSEPEKVVVEKEPESDNYDDKSIEELKEIERKLKAEPQAENGEKEASEVENPKVEEKPKIDYEKEWKASQSMIGRQSQEVREVRQRIAELEAKLNQKATPEPEPSMSDDELTALMLESPRKALAVVKGEEQAVEEKRRSEMIERSRVLKTIAPDLEANAEMISRIMKDEDGLTDEQILHIAKNIDRVPQDIIFNYNQRAKAAKKMAEYEAQIAKLKGIPEKISDAAKGQSILSKTASAATTGIREYSDAELDAMSPAELKKLEKELKKRG